MRQRDNREIGMDVLFYFWYEHIVYNIKKEFNILSENIYWNFNYFVDFNVFLCK